MNLTGEYLVAVCMMGIGYVLYAGVARTFNPFAPESRALSRRRRRSARIAWSAAALSPLVLLWYPTTSGFLPALLRSLGCAAALLVVSAGAAAALWLVTETGRRLGMRRGPRPERTIRLKSFDGATIVDYVDSGNDTLPGAAEHAPPPIVPGPLPPVPAWLAAPIEPSEPAEPCDAMTESVTVAPTDQDNESVLATLERLLEEHAGFVPPAETVAIASAPVSKNDALDCLRLENRLLRALLDDEHKRLVDRQEALHTAYATARDAITRADEAMQARDQAVRIASAERSARHATASEHQDGHALPA